MQTRRQMRNPSIIIPDSSPSYPRNNTVFSNFQDRAEVPALLPTSAITSDMMAIGELLATVKQTLKAIGPTLGGPIECGSITAETDIESEDQIREQRLSQQSQLAQAKAMLESVLKGQVSQQLHTSARNVIQEVAEKEIMVGVYGQVKGQIMTKALEPVPTVTVSRQRQALEIRTNSPNLSYGESKSHNSTHCQSSLSVPLRPLLRPLPTPFQSPCVSTLSSPFVSNLSVPPTPSVPMNPLVTPITTVNTSFSFPYPHDSSSSFKKRLDSSAGLDLELEPATPSPLFPTDPANLRKLKPDEARRLVIEYGLMGSNFDHSRMTASNGEMTPIKRVPEPCFHIPAWALKECTPEAEMNQDIDFDNFDCDEIEEMVQFDIKPF